VTATINFLVNKLLCFINWMNNRHQLNFSFFMDFFKDIPAGLAKLIKIQDGFSDMDVDMSFVINEMAADDFFINEIVEYPSIRPFSLPFITNLCIYYPSDHESLKSFRAKLLKKALKLCPVIIWKLFNEGFYNIDEIKDEIQKLESTLAALYFWRNIPTLPQFVFSFPDSDRYQEIQFTISNNDNHSLDQLIEYGAQMNSFYYCLKYDELSTINNMLEDPSIELPSELEWSDFEWTKKPCSLDILSISAYFGSLGVFKFLMMNKFRITTSCMKCAVSSGNLELIHLCNSSFPDIYIFSSDAAFYQRFDVFEWIYSQSRKYAPESVNTRNIRLLYIILENGGNLNQIDTVPIYFLKYFFNFWKNPITFRM